MKMDFKLVVYFALVGSVCDTHIRFASAKYFTDQPPDGYFRRKTMADCPNRFNKYFGPQFPAAAAGGERAFAGEFQHMAAIGWTKNGKTEYNCGGTLISPTFVLTAAHCARADGKPPDTVRLGDTNLEGSEDDEFAQQIKIKSFIRHPDHRYSKKYYDIALIELETKARYNRAICPACLWLEEELPPEEMTAIGFGRTGFATSLSSTLQKVRLDVLDNTECSEAFPKSKRMPDGLKKEQFCANNPTMDTCEGDSGGPIQVERIHVDKNSFPLVVGVVSFGSLCIHGSAGVYSKVAPYKDWIEEQIKSQIDYLACTRTECSRNQSHAFVFKAQSQPQYNVGLVWDSADQGSSQCGATLIDYRFALTSAFCAKTKQGSPRYISANVGVDTELVPIEKVFVHPRYNGKKLNDIALIKLTKYSNPSFNTVSPICLWREKQVDNEYGGMFFSVFSNSGDGYQRYKIGTFSGESEKCAEMKNNNNKLLCRQNKIDFIPHVCEIDYGGSVIYDSYQDSPYLYGVMSRHNKGCGNNLVGTRVYPYLEWIESIVLDNNQ